MWHGVDEPEADTMTGQNTMQGLKLSRAISGTMQEDRKTSVRRDALDAMTGSQVLDLVKGRDSQWPVIAEFLSNRVGRVICPIASK